MKLSLVPRTTEFYDLFTAAGENALATAHKAEERFRAFPEHVVHQQEVKELENRGDDLTRQIIELLNTQYITPFDREDIYELAKAIDDVVDYIENASDLLGLYQVGRAMDQAISLCDVLVSAVENLAKALAELRGLRNAERYLIEVKRLEDDGDRILREALAALFKGGEVDAMTVIRWKDILEALEDAIDASETAADVVGNIVVKNL
jgi:predicted phosphate transport protein (TIGR00153 family)